MVKAFEADDDRIPAPVHVSPTGIRGKPFKTVRKINRTAPPSLQDEVVRIVETCDPLELLMAIVNGQPIESHVVEVDKETGEPVISTYYETASLHQRERVARNLVDRYMPKVSVHAHLMGGQGSGKKGNNGGQNHPSGSFDQIVAAAAHEAERRMNGDGGNTIEGSAEEVDDDEQ